MAHVIPWNVELDGEVITNQEITVPLEHYVNPEQFDPNNPEHRRILDDAVCDHITDQFNATVTWDYPESHDQRWEAMKEYMKYVREHSD